LEQFFDTALVQDNDITCVISGKYVAISEDRFAGVFNLPTDGLTDLSEVPNHLVLQERTMFSKSKKPVQYSCKKRLLKYELRLLNDILAKSITVKAGSFDVVTHERFLMMTAIHFGVKINWSKILFEVLKDMADRTIKRAKGFAAQICVLLKGDPAVKSWGWHRVYIVAIGPVRGDVSIPRRVVDFVSYRIQIIDSVLPEPSVQTSPVLDSASVPIDFASLSPRNSDISLPSPHQSPSTDTSMHFDTAGIFGLLFLRFLSSSCNTKQNWPSPEFYIFKDRYSRESCCRGSY
ncbi:mitochondrial outer membrane import complex protein METAXIN, partial [Dorcoceras hygrometricum]